MLLCWACNVPPPVIETGDAEDEDGAQDVDAVHHGQAEHQLVEVTLHDLNISHNSVISSFIIMTIMSSVLSDLFWDVHHCENITIIIIIMPL